MKQLITAARTAFGYPPDLKLADIIAPFKQMEDNLDAFIAQSYNRADDLNFQIQTLELQVDQHATAADEAFRILQRVKAVTA